MKGRSKERGKRKRRGRRGKRRPEKEEELGEEGERERRKGKGRKGKRGEDSFSGLRVNLHTYMHNNGHKITLIRAQFTYLRLQVFIVRVH